MTGLGTVSQKRKSDGIPKNGPSNTTWSSRRMRGG